MTGRLDPRQVEVLDEAMAEVLRQKRPQDRLRIEFNLRSPWQNPYCERLIASMRRDCLDHVIVLGESHLRRILGRYFHYCHKYRTHLSLEKDAPEPRSIQEVRLGEVIEIPEVGGLHHHYERRAA